MSSVSAPALGVPLTLITIVGIILNGYILFVIILTKQSSSANNLLLLHLGLVDILIGSLFLIFTLPSFATRPAWLSSGALCTLNGFLFTLLHPVALWTICGLNCDRYYAIAAPLHYSALVNSKKVAIGLGIAWFTCILLCIPPLFTVAPYRYISHLGSCAPDFSIGNDVIWYSTSYTTLSLLLPAALILGCNIKVLMIARYHRHRIASAIYEVTLSAQVAITHQRNPFFIPTITPPSGVNLKFRSKNALSALLQLMGSFIILYFPYYAIIMWDSLPFINTAEKLSKTHSHLTTVASFLIVCSPSVNGLLYGVKSKTLRKSFQNYWRKQITKNEVNQEIQARTPSTCGSRRPSLTPLGILSKPYLQRRLSEAFIDINQQVSPNKSKIKRIASELSWKPGSSTAISLCTSENTRSMLPRTPSCNTLQVPTIQTQMSSNGENETYLTFTTNKRPVKNFPALQLSPPTDKYLVHFSNRSTIFKSPARRPKILVTRAYSEESDNVPNSQQEITSPRSIVAIMNRKQSLSATTLLERKWRTFTTITKTTDDDSDSSDIQIECPKKNLRITVDPNSATSSISDISSGKMYMSLDDRISFEKPETDSDYLGTEESLLLSWPPTKKPPGLKHHNASENPVFIKPKTVRGSNTSVELVL